MSPLEAIGLLALLAAVALYALVQRERDLPDDVRAARLAARLAEEGSDGVGAPPMQPSQPESWAVLVDTASDARFADDELLYAESVLRAEGIATEFEPWRPGEHFGQIGPQYPLRLLVDAQRVEEARVVLGEIFSAIPPRNWQVRLVNPVVNVPGTREEMMLYAGLRRRAAQGGWWKIAWWILVAMLLLGLIEPVIYRY
jgi:hypothetical protein